MLNVRDHIEDLKKSKNVTNEFIIKLMTFAKSEFSNDCITITPKPSNEDLLNSEIQPSAKPIAINLKFTLEKYQYGKKFIVDEIEFFEQWADEKEYDECLRDLMMEEYEKHRIVYLQCNTVLCETTRECMKIDCPPGHSLEFDKSLIDQVESFIKSHPEHIEVLYQSHSSLWGIHESPVFKNSKEFVEYIKNGYCPVHAYSSNHDGTTNHEIKHVKRPPHELDAHEKLLIDWFSEYELNPDDIIIK